MGLNIIGVSLSEPHINGTVVCKLYIIYFFYGTSVTWNICPAWFYGHKREIFYCAFPFLGHRPYVCGSNLVNCRFILVLLVQYNTRQSSPSWHESWTKCKPEKSKAAKKPPRTELVVNHSQLNSARSGNRDRLLNIVHWDCTTEAAMQLSCQATVAIDCWHTE